MRQLRSVFLCSGGRSSKEDSAQKTRVQFTKRQRDATRTRSCFSYLFFISSQCLHFRCVDSVERVDPWCLADVVYESMNLRREQPSKAVNDFLSDVAADFGLKPFLLQCSCSGRCPFEKVPSRETPYGEIRQKLEHFRVRGSSKAPLSPLVPDCLFNRHATMNGCT